MHNKCTHFNWAHLINWSKKSTFLKFISWFFSILRSKTLGPRVSMFFLNVFFLQSSISGILINILIGRRFILAMSGLALSSHSALIPHLLTWPTTTKRPSPALLLPDLLLNRAVEKYSYLTTSMATSYLLLLTKSPAHLINLLNSSNLYIICTLQQSDSASVSYVYLEVSSSLIDF